MKRIYSHQISWPDRELKASPRGRRHSRASWIRGPSYSVYPAKITASSSAFKPERRLPRSWVSAQKAKNWPSRHSRNREAFAHHSRPFSRWRSWTYGCRFRSSSYNGTALIGMSVWTADRGSAIHLGHNYRSLPGYGSTYLVLLSSSPLNTCCCTKAHNLAGYGQHLQLVQHCIAFRISLSGLKASRISRTSIPLIMLRRRGNFTVKFDLVLLVPDFSGQIEKVSGTLSMISIIQQYAPIGLWFLLAEVISLRSQVSCSYSQVESSAQIIARICCWCRNIHT